MFILEETQLQRDQELSKYTGRPVSEIEKLAIASKKSIQLYKNEDIVQDDYSFIYQDYKYLDEVDYLRTLTALTVIRRASYIRSLEKVVSLQGLCVLDFGSGVGSHGIACKQLGADTVDMLDVDGPLQRYAKWRVSQRGLKGINFLPHTAKLPFEKYDLILCLDVLEHISKPVETFKSITSSLKPQGFLSIEVSEMIKPTSGHFSKSIHEWRAFGRKYLVENYTMESSGIWRKKSCQ